MLKWEVTNMNESLGISELNPKARMQVIFKVGRAESAA